MFENSSWIWAAACPERDEYAEFREDFEFDGNALTLRISADSDYAVYVNGVYAASGQYGDFEYWKIADEIDLAPFCQQGKMPLPSLHGTGGKRICPSTAPERRV